MVEVCLWVILALDSHIDPQAKVLRPIWLPQCQYDLKAHLGHKITCIYYVSWVPFIKSFLFNAFGNEMLSLISIV